MVWLDICCRIKVGFLFLDLVFIHFVLLKTCFFSTKAVTLTWPELEQLICEMFYIDNYHPLGLDFDYQKIFFTFLLSVFKKNPTKLVIATKKNGSMELFLRRSGCRC
jgi:hypothetical protein